MLVLDSVYQHGIGTRKRCQHQSDICSGPSVFAHSATSLLPSFADKQICSSSWQ